MSRPINRRRRMSARAGVAAAMLALVGLVALSGPTTGRGGLGGTPAAAEPSGDPWVVSLGDSYISGEGGRWAGNSNTSYELVDALGPTAYFDNPTDTGELIPGCHRSKSAEVHIGGGVNSLNLACSGAETTTKFEGSVFKPGIDFFDQDGKQGQALMLQEFATTHRVDHVAVSIGGNNFQFENIVKTCTLDYAKSTPIYNVYCSQDPNILALISPQSVDTNRAAIVTALRNVRQAMSAAGYADGSYSVSVQGYPAPTPPSRDFRYGEGYDRIYDGGCGLWNVDVDWALNEALRTVNTTVFQAAAESGLSNVQLVDLTTLTHDRELCNKAVNLIPDGIVSSWSFPGAVDVSEWINQIRTLTTIVGPYELQESMHPNYWAQLALRNCLRQVYNGGAAQGGTCVRSGDGLDANGEPPVTLQAGFQSLVPSVAPDAYETTPDTALSVASPGVLNNDHAAEDALVTAALEGAPDHGQVTLLSDGSFTYTPDAGFSGVDSFTYRAATLSASSEPVTVTITVHEAEVVPTPDVLVTPRFTG